jgi:hypothetical protein
MEKKFASTAVRMLKPYILTTHYKFTQHSTSLLKIPSYLKKENNSEHMNFKKIKKKNAIFFPVFVVMGACSSVVG